MHSLPSGVRDPRAVPYSAICIAVHGRPCGATPSSTAIGCGSEHPAAAAAWLAVAPVKVSHLRPQCQHAVCERRPKLLRLAAEKVTEEKSDGRSYRQ
jgi:hypothetical protein